MSRMTEVNDRFVKTCAAEGFRLPRALVADDDEIIYYLRRGDDVYVDIGVDSAGELAFYARLPGGRMLQGDEVSPEALSDDLREVLRHMTAALDALASDR